MAPDTMRLTLVWRFIVVIALVASGAVGASGPLEPDVAAARTLFNTRGKSADAQKAFEAIVATRPDNHASLLHLGLLAIRRDDMERAVSYLERAVALAPSDGDSHKALGDAYGRSAQKASVFKQLGWAKKCLASYERAVALAPDRADFHQCLFEYYFQAPGFAGGGRDKAITEARIIKKLDAHAGRLAFSRLHLDDKKYDAALAEFDEALKTNPDDYRSHYEIGRLAALTGKFVERGVASLRRCLELSPPHGAEIPSHANVQWRLGQLLEKSGDRGAARGAYEAALNLDPSFAPASEALRKMK